MVQEKDVLNVLSTVQEPELHKDLVTLNMIKDISIKNSSVEFTIVLTTLACPLKEKIRSDAKNAVLTLPEVEDVKVNLSSNVPSDGIARQSSDLKIKNAVAVASGKGGVGKSTVAVNLAVALAKCGAKVGLLDADIYGPNVPTMMGVKTIPPPQNKKMIPAEAYGVKIISIGFLVKPGQALVWRGPMLHSAVRQFITDVDWGELDYLIIDLPPGTGDVQLSLAQTMPLSGGVIVTLPQAVSVEDASRGIQMFNTLNVPILGVIENMSYLEMPDGSKMDIFGQGGGEQLASEADVPFLGAIPLESNIRESGDKGKPIVFSNPDSSAARRLEELASKLAAALSVKAFSGVTTGKDKS